MKPKFTLIAVSSIDGKIAHYSDELVNWSSPEDKKFLYKKIDEADVILMGRKTYETVKDRIKKDCIIFTRSLNEDNQNNLHFINPEEIDLIEFLKQKNWQKISVLGGTQIFNYFLQNNLIDEIFLTIEPIVFGAGLSLFDELIVTKKFQLVEVKKLNEEGAVLLHYDFAKHKT